jgi:hypothetical protein
MCLKDTFTVVSKGKYLSDVSPIQKGLNLGNAYAPLFLSSKIFHSKIQSKSGNAGIKGTLELPVC